MLKNRILLNRIIMMNFLGFHLNLKVYAKNTSAKEMPFRSYFNGLMFPEL